MNTEEFAKQQGWDWFPKQQVLTAAQAEQYAREFAAEQLERAAKSVCQWCRKDYEVLLVNGIWEHSPGSHDCHAGDLHDRVDMLRGKQ